MGSNVSTASPVTPEGLGCVLHEQGGGNGAGPYRAGSVYSRQGGKSVNQDSAVLCQGYGTKDGIFCGVFDGHGKNGHKVSRIVRQRLPVLLLDKTNLLAEADGELDGNLFENQETSYDDFSSNGKFHQWEEACVNAFEEMDKEIKLIRNLDSNFSGTTAVVVMKKYQLQSVWLMGNLNGVKILLLLILVIQELCWEQKQKMESKLFS